MGYHVSIWMYQVNRINLMFGCLLTGEQLKFVGETRIDYTVKLPVKQVVKTSWNYECSDDHCRQRRLDLLLDFF